MNAAPQTAKIFVDAGDVAGIIGFLTREGGPDRDAFLAARARLEEEEAFPLPMPTSRRPLLWRRDQVEAWVDRQGLPRAEKEAHEAQLLPANLPPNVVLMREAARP